MLDKQQTKKLANFFKENILPMLKEYEKELDEMHKYTKEINKSFESPSSEGMIAKNTKTTEKVGYSGKFKERDIVKVKIVTTPTETLKKEGVIILVDVESSVFPYLVKFEDGLALWFNEVALEPLANEKVTKQNNDIDSLKSRTFEILSKGLDVKFIEKELRDYAELAVDDYDYDRAIEIYGLTKEWNNLK